MPRFIGFKSSCPEVFLEESVLKISRKFIDRPCRSMISTRSLHNFIEITLQHDCSPVNVLHIFRTPFPKNTSGQLHLAFLRNVFFFNLKYGRSIRSDATALYFLKGFDSTNCYMWVLVRLGF